jgi:hypothetical protein
MRKCILSLGCFLFMAGVALSAEVTLKSFNKEKKEVTVTDKDGKDNTYKITDKTKIVFTDKDGNAKEGTYDAVEKILGNEKAAGRAKFDLTADKDVVTEIKLKARKGN